MTVIRPNSISGITSLTAHRGSIDFYAHDGSAATFNNINSNVTSGVSTFASLNITGDIDVGGALTYEDVTNIDSVGVITARQGIHVTGGNVKIGTTTEGEVTADNLTIADAGHCGMTIRSGASSEGNIFFSDGTSGDSEYRGMVRYEHSNDAMVFKTATVERLRIDSAGNLGIKNTSPNNTLTVGDTVQPSYAPSSAGNYIEIARTSGADAGLLINKNTGQWLVGIDNSDGANAPLRFEYGAAGSAHPGFGAGTLGMIIKHDGKIGINTDNPKQKLSVVGRVNFDNNGDYYGAWIDGDSTGSSSFNVGVWHNAGGRMRNEGSHLVLETINTSHNVQLQPSGGNVGVGEESPDRLLHIKGTSSTAYSGGSDTADYNFLKIENTTNDKSAGIFFQIGGNGEAAITATEVADGNTDICFQNRGGGVRSEKLRITSDGKVGIGENNPADILHLKNNAPIITTEATNASSGLRLNVLGQTSATSQIFRIQNDNSTLFTVLKSGNVGVLDSAPSSLLSISQTNGNAKLQIKRSNTANNTDDYGSILWRSSGGTAVGGINVARQTAENNGYMFFQTANGGSLTERLRISADGGIIKGSTNSSTSSQVIQTFFNKRGSLIGKRVHQGASSGSTTHNLLTINSFQSNNTRFFAYVTVHYVNPIANVGGRMETYAGATTAGARVVGTFAVADGGRWGNPGGTLSLSWSGNTLQLNTYNNAYMEYSVDITYVAYDGASVTFATN